MTQNLIETTIRMILRLVVTIESPEVEPDGESEFVSRSMKATGGMIDGFLLAAILTSPVWLPIVVGIAIYRRFTD